MNKIYLIYLITFLYPWYFIFTQEIGRFPIGDFEIISLKAIPNSHDVLVSNNNGEIFKVDINQKKIVWRVQERPNLYLYILDVSSKHFLTSTVRAMEGGIADLQIRDINTGNTIHRISETSKYTSNEFDLTGERMRVYSAKFLNDGSFLTVWVNQKMTNGQFDQSIKYYSKSWKKLWEWQAVSPHLPGQRAGFYSAYAPPTVDILNENQFIYGDSDGDIRLLNLELIQKSQQIKKIEDKPFPTLLLELKYNKKTITPLRILVQENKLIIWGNVPAENSYFCIYDLTNKTFSLDWMVLPIMGSYSYQFPYSAFFGKELRIYNHKTNNFELQKFGNFGSIGDILNSQMVVTVYGNYLVIFRLN